MEYLIDWLIRFVFMVDSFLQTYLPNPHGLLYIPDTEQDFRAKQMAETGKKSPIAFFFLFLFL